MRTEPKFKSLIPPLTEEEHIQLEQNILQDGIREPISIWNDTIIDGHNRYEIAQKHNLTYTTVNYEFENENDVIFWIIKNQFGRRNLTAYDRSLLALKLKPVIAEKAKENQGERTDLTSVRNLTNVDTKKELAEIANVSHDTIAKVEKIQEKAIEPVKELLKKDELSVNQAEKVSRLDTETQEKILPYIRQGIKVDDALREITDTEDEPILDDEESETEYKSPKIRDMSEYLRNKGQQEIEEYDKRLDLGHEIFKKMSKILDVIDSYFDTAKQNIEPLTEYCDENFSLDEYIRYVNTAIDKLQMIKIDLLRGKKYEKGKN